jgi:hypothetical protein
VPNPADPHIAPTLSLLLPAWSAFGRQSLRPDIARALGRADAPPATEVGRRAQLQRYFALLPNRWPPAALTRQCDASDAAGALWLRADPAHVRPDINGARLFAHGERLAVSAADVEALLPALKPLFGDAGFALDAPSPQRWYLRLPEGSDCPQFSEPDDALGEDLFEHQPEGPAGRRWRTLLSEAQIVLHNHPRNAERAARGLMPINALWIWGGGKLPDSVRSELVRVGSDRDLLIALARLVDASGERLPPTLPIAHAAGPALFDLVQMRDLAALQRDWLQPALDALRDGAIRALTLDSLDGIRLRCEPRQRLRFWRRPWAPQT